jgi:hypothetical protein
MEVERIEQWENDLKLNLLGKIYSLTKEYFGGEASLGGPGLPWICVLPYSGASLDDPLLGMDLDRHYFNCGEEVEGRARGFVRAYEKILALKSQGEEAHLSIN